MTLLTSRKTLAFCLTGVFLAISATSSAQTVHHRPWQPGPGADAPQPSDRAVIVSRPFAHPAAATVVDPQPAPFLQRTAPENPSSPSGSANWKKLIKLIRRNAKLEAAVEKTKAIAEVELRAVQAIADIERRVAEEKAAMLKEMNESLRGRIEELEQEIDQAEQEMRERSIHAEHMERQMMQRTELIEELERRLQQAHRPRDQNRRPNQNRD